MPEFGKEFERAPLPPDGMPAPLCSSCADGALFHRATEISLVYCPHAHAGAVLPMNESKWYVTEAVTLDEFKEQVLHEIAAAMLLRRRGKPH